MMPARHLLAAAFLTTAIVVVVTTPPAARAAPPAATAPADVTLVAQLLARAAPPADWEQTHPPSYAPGGFVPGPDATDDVLLAYWTDEDRRDARLAGIQLPAAPPEVRRRLVEAAFRDPSRLPAVLSFGLLPDAPDVHDRLKALYDRTPDDESSREWREDARDWLMTHSRYFREDLVRAAGEVEFKDGYVWGDQNLAALARLDWPAAKPVVALLIVSPEPHLAAEAAAVAYAHHAGAGGDKAEAGKLRGLLKAIARNPKAPGSARDRAVEAVMAGDWPGRDEWFLSLFADPTLRQGQEGHVLHMPLCGPVARDPDYWIPKVVKLVAGPDRAAHDAAVTCLAQFNLEQARADALAPLLPWLADPDWADAGDGRLRLVQSLDRVDLPQSVPGLIRVVETETGYMLAGAAEALAKYKAKEAGPALRAAYDRETEEHHRRSVLAGIVACGGMTPDEMADAVVAYAAEAAKPDWRERLERAGPIGADPLPPKVSLGMALSNQGGERDDLAALLLARAAGLREKQPAVAEEVVRAISDWPVRPVDEAFVGRLAGGRLDVETVGMAIGRAKWMRQNVAPELARLAARGGTVAGVAAALLGDGGVAGTVLKGNDDPAKSALLACARLERLPLAVADVAPLLAAGDGTVVRAAELYLAAEDSPAARQAIRDRHPGELLIFGAGGFFDPGFAAGQKVGAPANENEKALAAEVTAKDGPDEVFALYGAGGFGSPGDWIVRIKGGKARLDYNPGGGKVLTRPLTDAERKELADLIRRTNFDDLPPLSNHVFDGVWFNYVHLTRAGGRRLYMNNPGIGGTAGTPYDQVVKLFQKLRDTGKMTPRYAVADVVPGVEVVLSERDRHVAAAWKKGDDLRVLVHDGGPNGEGAWHAARDGRIGPPAEQPADCPALGTEDDVPKDFDRGVYTHDSDRWKARLGDDYVRTGGIDIGGLWLCRAGRRPVQVSDQTFGSPIATPDGRWVVALWGTNPAWAHPRQLVRVEVPRDPARGPWKAVRVADLPAWAVFYPEAYLPSHGKVLLKGIGNPPGDKAGDDAAPPQFRLLDPATGKSDAVAGEFAPLLDQSYRPLQPTGRPDEAWAAVREEKREQFRDGELVRVKFSTTTRVGRYDVKRFTFTPLLTLPDLSFTSMEMWVDEPGGNIYVAVNGDLLRIPLPRDAAGGGR